MKPLEFYDEAEEELQHALDVSAQRDPRIATKFRAHVDQPLKNICSGLITPASFPRTSCREYLLHPYPYTIVYLDDPDMIRIVAFAHTRRRRGYWKSRPHRS